MADRKVTVLTGADGNDYDIRDDELWESVGTIPEGSTVEGQISDLNLALNGIGLAIEDGVLVIQPVTA